MREEIWPYDTGAWSRRFVDQIHEIMLYILQQHSITRPKLARVTISLYGIVQRAKLQASVRGANGIPRNSTASTEDPIF
jgi:hypothetical protein